MKKILANRKYIYLALILFVILLPKINVMNVSNNKTGIRPEDFLTIYFMYYYIKNIIWKKKIKINNKSVIKVTKIFIIYNIIILISTILGIMNQNIKPVLGILYFARKIEYFILFFVGYDIIKNDRINQNTIEKLFTCTLYIHFIISLLQTMGIIGSFNSGKLLAIMTQGRVSSTFNGAYEFSAYLLILLPFYTYDLFVKDNAKIKNIINIAIIFLCIFMSKSRTSLVIFVAMIVMMFFVYHRNKKLKITIASIGAIFILVFGLGMIDLSPILKGTRFETINLKSMTETIELTWKYKNFDKYVATGSWFGDNPNIIDFNADKSFIIRVSHWMQLIDGFLRYPLFGAGASISQSAADGNYIRIIAESGILGMASWVYLNFYIIKSTKNTIENKWNYVARYGLYSMFLGAIFIDVFEASKIMMMYWLILGITYAINEKNQNNKSKENEIENVVIVNDFNYIQGGASKVSIDTAKLLMKEGYKVYFFSAVNDKEQDIEGIEYITTNQCEALKDKNRARGIINGIYNIKAKNEFKKLLEKLDKNKTIIHIHGWTKALSCSVFSIAHEMEFKIVLTLHDYFSSCPNGAFYNYKTDKICDLRGNSFKCACTDCDSRNYLFKVYRVVRQFVQNEIVELKEKVQCAIGISDLNIEILKEQFPEKFSIHKVSNPIDIGKAQKIENIEQNEYYLYVGRVSKEKGVKIFCDIITQLNFKGIVLGDGSELEKLKEQYPNISFEGWKNTEEVKEYITKSRGLIFPSLWYEGAPLTPLEFMSQGIPCAISDKCAGREYINGENGVIINPYDIEDAKDKILYMDKNLKNMSEKSYEYFKQISDRSYVKELIKVYNSMEE